MPTSPRPSHDVALIMPIDREVGDGMRHPCEMLRLSALDIVQARLMPYLQGAARHATV